jgi:hypothetical protein
LALTAASKGELVFWTDAGIIVAGVENVGGSGRHRRFSSLNVIEVELCAVLNGFKLPAAALRAAVYTLQHFHRRALAVQGEMTGAPLVTDPPHLAHFPTLEVRRSSAQTFLKEQRERTRRHADPRAVAAYVRELVTAWAWVRSGPLSRGEGDASWPHFLGLFLTGAYVDREHTSAFVALDPELAEMVQETAIVIDLANVVFRVGERCRRLSCALAEW